jgi:hypothetical protein
VHVRHAVDPDRAEGKFLEAHIPPRFQKIFDRLQVGQAEITAHFDTDKNIAMPIWKICLKPATCGK